MDSVSGICTPFPPLQGFVTCRAPINFPLSKSHQSLTKGFFNLHGKGESAAGKIVFSGWEMGRGRVEGLAGQTWGDKLTAVRQSRTFFLASFIAAWIPPQQFEKLQWMYLGCYLQQNFEIWGWGSHEICQECACASEHLCASRYLPDDIQSWVMCALCMSSFVGRLFLS